MADNSPLSHVGKGEFFSILTPGFHILIVLLFLALGLGDQGSAQSAWDRIEPVANAVSDNWFLAVLALFAAYLLGSILRAIPVSRLDEGWARNVGRLRAGDKFAKTFMRSEFPYPRTLRRTLKHLQAYDFARTQTIALDVDAAHTIYNFWKISVCVKSPGAFAYTQALEESVRLFAGMVRAGVVGVVGSLVLLFHCQFSEQNRTIWVGPSFTMLVISAVMAYTFAVYLRRIRAREACHVYMAYLASLDCGCGNSERPVTPDARNGNNGDPVLPAPGASLQPAAAIPAAQNKKQTRRRKQ